MSLSDIIPQTHLTAARDEQLRALAPFPARPLRNNWGLTRPPLPNPPAPAQNFQRADALLRAAFPATDRPRVMSGILNIVTAGTNSYVSVSQPIPFPWRLTNLHIATPALAPANEDRLAVTVLDDDTGSDNAPIQGQIVWTGPARAAGLVSFDAMNGMIASRPNIFNTVLPVPLVDVYEAGKRLAMFVKLTAGGTGVWGAFWMIEELIEARSRG